MKIKIKFFIGIFLIILLSTDYCNAQSYSREIEFGPLRFSYLELKTILSNLESTLETTNKETNTKNSYYEKRKVIQIKNNDTTVTFEDPNDLETYERLPSTGLEFDYSYNLPEGKVSDVQLSFNDYRRKLTVKGSDPNQVDAIFALLREQIIKKQILLGGYMTHAVLKLILFIVMFFLFISLINAILSKTYKIMSILIIFELSFLSILIFFPIDIWLSGFVVYAGDTSFLVRYSPQIAFYGLIFTTILTVLFYYFPRREKNKN